jgi:hypothetical protein
MKAIWGVAGHFVLVIGLAGVTGVSGACGASGGGPEFSSDHPRIYLNSHKDALSDALKAGGPAAARFKTSADRWVGGSDVYNFSPWNAALVGQLTGDAKYCAAAVKAIDKQVTDATSQISAGKLPDVASDNYLGVGNLIGNLSLVYDWCAGSLAADRRAAWLAYADQAVYNVWNNMAAKWGNANASWSGWAVDDPSDNYYYSFLRATLLFGLAAKGETPRAQDWIAKFQDKINTQLVPTFDMDLVGGGSREGTGYGVAQRDLFELYDVWDSSTGERIADLTPHTRASMLSFMHQVVPTLDRFAPTGDQSRDSTAQLFDYHRSYLQDLITLYPSDPLAPRAQALLAASSLPKMSSEFMYVNDFLYANSNVQASTLDGLGTAYYAPGIGEIYARSSWDKHATWINMIAGPYTQSHAHQDQGSLMIYKDGWLAYDAVVDSHSGLPQQTTAHSLVRIVDGGNTVEQKLNTETKLLALHHVPGSYLHVAADMTPTYKNSASVQSSQREIVYLEPDTVVVYDRITTRASAQQVFQLVSPVIPMITGTVAKFTSIVPPSSMISTAGTTVSHTLTVNTVVAPAGTLTGIAYDLKKNDMDFNAGFRFDETYTGGDNRALHLLTIDDAATNILTGNTSDKDGVQMTLKGQTVTVLFNRNAVGGTLTIGSANPITLAAGIDKLPE